MYIYIYIERYIYIYTCIYTRLRRDVRGDSISATRVAKECIHQSLAGQTSRVVPCTSK